ncbi:hypothetical protein [Elizabethkingia anophelis]|uniref:hypothetical protein n=1 Tax=Elizabethkingia anophelis TaxID=1117645 RepID=UPI002012A517|nr:hypothetical protein [Elizabethkingia anophelis]MCL1691957.1 hypothetical protein [Elizabethkingia anophelis]
MRKLIFILIAMLFITACSSGDNRDNTEPPKEYKLQPEFYLKYSAKYISMNTINSNGDRIKISAKSDNDLYMIVNSDNTATLKIFNDTYSGLIEIVNNNYFILKNPVSKRGIHIQNSLNGRSISGLSKVNDGSISYDICGDCTGTLEMMK